MIHTKGGMRNSAVKADRYFSSLTVEQVTKLYEIYKYDFQMYGYEYQSYLKLAELNMEKKKNDFQRKNSTRAKNINSVDHLQKFPH